MLKKTSKRLNKRIQCKFRDIISPQSYCNRAKVQMPSERPNNCLSINPSQGNQDPNYNYNKKVPYSKVSTEKK